MMLESRLLKKDLFGEVRLEFDGNRQRIVRDVAPAALPLRWLAQMLMRREARALAALDGLDGVPGLIRVDRDRLQREYLDGVAMHRAKPRDAEYFRRAMRLLRQLHARGVVHNDLAKEPNILVVGGGLPAFVDFQLAWHAPGRGRLFRILAYDDLRHLLKHKRSYCADELTQRERRILARPSLPSRLWMRIVKPPYLFLTRRVLGWADREGASDRGERR
jgi:RIO-like serine/threonine protein kinase